MRSYMLHILINRLTHLPIETNFKIYSRAMKQFTKRLTHSLKFTEFSNLNRNDFEIYKKLVGHVIKSREARVPTILSLFVFFSFSMTIHTRSYFLLSENKVQSLWFVHILSSYIMWLHQNIWCTVKTQYLILFQRAVI